MVIKDGRDSYQQTAGVESEARKIFDELKPPAE
jgi:hypothetical protein